MANDQSSPQPPAQSRPKPPLLNLHYGIEYRVVNYIGMALLLLLAGGITITAVKSGDITWIKDIALVLAGSLGAMLANTNRNNQGTPQNPASVEVRNPPENPVNVTETKSGEEHKNEP